MRKTMSLLLVGIVSVGLTGDLTARAQAPSLRSGRSGGLTLRLATTKPTRGFNAIAVGRDQTLYVAPRNVLSRSDVTAAQAIAMRNGSDVELSLTADAASRLDGMVRKHGVDHLAIFVNGKFQAAAPVQVDPSAGRVVLGGLSPGQAKRLTQLVGVEPGLPAGPVVSLVASQSVIQPGDEVVLDVMLNGTVKDLDAYQVTLMVTGGDSGKMTVNNVQVNEAASADYVFGTRQILPAEDLFGGRLGAVLMNGSVDTAAGPVRLGTYTVTASPDAAGTFQVQIRPDLKASMLVNSANRVMRFASAPPVAISVGGPQKVTPTGR